MKIKMMPKKNTRRAREWNKLLSREQKYLYARREERENSIACRVEAFMPDNLQSVVEKTFAAAFRLVFEKGTFLIEHTYNRTKIEKDYQVNAYAASVYRRDGDLRAFDRQAARSCRVNMAVSAVEGTVLGAFGVGVPDIPLFLGVLLRSVYQTALHYGFSYDSRDEQMFILRVIEAAMCRGRELQLKDIQINRWIDGEEELDDDREGQIQRTAQALSRALLDMKYVQMLPIVGAVGGTVDVWCMREVTAYARLKYQRRFLTREA